MYVTSTSSGEIHSVELDRNGGDKNVWLHGAGPAVCFDLAEVPWLIRALGQALSADATVDPKEAGTVFKAVNPARESAP